MKARTTLILPFALGLSALFLSGCISDPYTSMRTGPYDPNGRIYPGTAGVGGGVYVDPYGRPVSPGYGNGGYGVYSSYGYGSQYPYGGGYYGGSPYPYGGYYGGYGYGSPYVGGYHPQVVVTPPPRHNTPQPPRVDRPPLPPRQPGEPPRTFRELFPKAPRDDRRPENIP